MIKLNFLMKLSLILLVPYGNLIGFSNRNQKLVYLTSTASPTPTGVIVRITEDYDQINIRSGPKTTYPQIGVLLASAEVTVYGISIGEDWIQVAFPESESERGWIYVPLVSFIEGNLGTLPIISAPPTPTPAASPTVDATLAAQFIEDIPPTKLPTYTPPVPLVIATYPPVTEHNSNQIPMGVVIFLLFMVGSLVGIFSITRNRNKR
jgi:hypothetical protein